MAKHVNLTAAEWELMEYLWGNVPCTGRAAAEHFNEAIGWSRTTTLTLLNRVVKKGAVLCDDGGGVNKYAPILTREDAVLQEAESFLSRICKGSVGMMMRAIVKKQNLSKEEIDALYEILEKAEARKDD